MNSLVETPIKYERLKKTVVLDKKVFNVCETKEKEVGILSKKQIYIHYDGKKWDLLIASRNFSKISYYTLE